MTGVGDDLILYGSNSSGAEFLWKMRGISSDNTYQLPVNYQDYAFWAGEAEVSGSPVHFQISPVQLRRDREFDSNGISFKWTHTNRRLELADRDDTFLEIYPIVYAKI